MEKLLQIPLELQIVLVAGYLAYKIATIGKARNHRTEDFLLQVLTFGVVARAASAAGLWLIPPPLDLDETLRVVGVAASTAITGVLLGAAWRSLGERRARDIMNGLAIYRDDHEASVWQSIMGNGYRWTVLQVHIDNGKVLEANFGAMSPMPKTPILMNEDGIGVYVTTIYPADGGAPQQVGIMGNDGDVIFTYIPRSSIKQIDVAWRLPPSNVQ